MKAPDPGKPTLIRPPTSTAFQLPSPVALSSQCNVLLGSTASPKMTELAYPYRKAVLIEEIRFDIWGTSNFPVNFGAQVYARLQIGQHYLMRDPVPVWLLGTLMSLREEFAGDTTDFMDTPTVYGHYRWRLPEPLYVAAGEYITPVFSYPALSGLPVTQPSSLTVQVTYAGRVVPPRTSKPKSIIVPYAAPFVTTYGQVYQQSNEYNLFNPFNKAINVQRITARVASIADGYVNQIRGYTPPPSTPTVLPTVQIFDSWGGKMVNDLTGPDDVADAFRAAWTVDTVLPPKGQYDVRVWNIPSTSSVHFGLIGSREEACP